jgi:adenylate kinase
MIILFGKPGAGKGTQADLLVKEEGFVLVGAGELLRAEARHNPALAEAMNAGKLVGGEILCPLIQKQLESFGHTRIILDGFPRDRAQAQWLKRQLEQNPPERIDLVILEISDDEVLDRLARRGRADDTAEAIQTRIDIYTHEVTKAIELLGEAANVHYIDGTGPVDEVHGLVIQVLNGGIV